MTFDRSAHTDEFLRQLYRALLLPRMIEEKMLLLLRQGKLSKWFSGIGQEAIAVGLTSALTPTDWVLPLHRNLGVFTTRQMPLRRLFAQWEGRKTGYTKGRDRSFHFGAPEHRIIGMISHLGAMLGVADGLALDSNLSGNPDITAVFSGDGGTSEGDFHEALNVAAVWDLPVIFVVENNGYGLSTPSAEQFRCRQFVDKAVGYGIEGLKCDGNNILEVFDAVSRITGAMRKNRRPVLLEAMTFRMRGHEEASGTKYVPPKLLEEWKKKDPVGNYERFLMENGILSQGDVKDAREEFKKTIDEEWEAAGAGGAVVPDKDEEHNDVYAPGGYALVSPNTQKTSKKRLVNAVADGLRQAMERDGNLVLMGQDIAEYGGVFKVTEGFVQQFGKDRVRNTPLCESAIVGASLGLAIAGRASMVEMQFADFVTCGFNQVVNNLAKTHYRWAQPVNVVVRMPTGAGVGAGPFHSQSTEAWFTRIPGLIVVYPSTPYDAKGLLTTSFLEPNPVLFFEHKFLYRSVEGTVPDEYYNLPIGKARVAREGTGATIVTYGWGVHWALEASADPAVGNIEIVDLCTLQPWDKETVYNSVRKTNRCLVLHEDTVTGGFGGELAASIQEECFAGLDAPVMRLGSMDTPVPFHPDLEKAFLPRGALKSKIQQLLAY